MLSIYHVYNWNSEAKLSRECVRKGSHVQEDSEKAGEIIKWKELAKEEPALVGGRFRDCEICTISYRLMLQCSMLVHKIWHDISPRDIHCYGRLSLWSLAAEKRSYPDDYTLFRISAFGGYYGITNKLVYFNCSGMYVFPVPTYPCLFLAYQKSYRLFFFCP